MRSNMSILKKQKLLKFLHILKLFITMWFVIEDCQWRLLFLILIILLIWNNKIWLTFWQQMRENYATRFIYFKQCYDWNTKKFASGSPVIIRQSKWKEKDKKKKPPALQDQKMPNSYMQSTFENPYFVNMLLEHIT